MPSPLFIKRLKSAAHLIRESRTIILACHLNPDGDAIGSMLGLGHALKKMKKSVTMLCPDKVPYRYITMPGAGLIAQQCSKPADLAISIDCASPNQLAKLDKVFSESKKIIEMDHHDYRTRFGDIQLVNHHACSVGEIIFLLLKELKVPIGKTIAECLLVSTLVETCSFSRQDVHRETFEICSQLMTKKVNFWEISQRYYWRKKLSAVHLSGLALARVKTRAKNRLAWSIIYKKDLERFHGSPEDVDAVADDMMMIENTEITLLFREIANNMLRVSLRSREGIDIGYLASSYGGGGHHDVAGCRIHNNKRTIERFIDQACQLLYQDK